MKVLITRSCGLIGSEAVAYSCALGHEVYGMDNNMRANFFGPDGDTDWMRKYLCEKYSNYHHSPGDIRDRSQVEKIFLEIHPDFVIHCAAQPSHDLAAKMPFEDFDVNALGTHNLLENFRRHTPEASFVFMSTNKVYGDGPNTIPLVELETRWDYNDPCFVRGISEQFSIDQCLHSIFGASKVAADVMAQEYGRYFGLKIGVFRGGCLTGISHSSAELHGYLAYVFKSAKEKRLYTIHGYKGKQVRDQIHAFDVVSAFYAFYKNPHPGEVYNLGGGKENSISILESFEKIKQLLGVRIDHKYSENNRTGDHIVYYTDLTKMKTHFPDWRITKSIDQIFEEFAAVSK